jgi:hypothetical protein
MNHAHMPSDSPMSADDRLRFLVRFALLDLNALRLGDWLNLQDDMIRFVQSADRLSWDGVLPPKVGIVVDPPPTLEAFQGTMRAVQPTLYHLLDTVAVDLTAEGAIDPQCLLRQDRLPVPPGEFVFSPGFRGVRGTLEQTMVRHAQDLIQDSPMQTLAHCRECGALFYRVRQQVQCSRACTNRVSKRRFRERHAAVPAAAAS